jgi:hypothetical protein
MTMEPSRSELFVASNGCHSAKTWGPPFLLLALKNRESGASNVSRSAHSVL